MRRHGPIRADRVARWAMLGVLCACSAAPPPAARAFAPVHSCKVTGSSFGAEPIGADVVVTEFERDRAVQLRMTDCAERRAWDVAGGPRSIARVRADAFAITTSAGLTLARPDGAARALPLTPAPNSAFSAGDGLVYATTGATSAEAKLVKAREEDGGLVLLAELALTGASAVTATDAGLVVARFSDQKQTAVDAALVAGTDLPGCADPFALTAFGSTLVTTCRTGGLELSRAGGRLRLPREGTLYDTVAVDLDLDGRVDLASVDPFAHELVLWWGAADGGFDAPTARATDRGPILLRSFDFDTDGRPELWVLAFQDRSVTVYRLEGTR